MVDLQSQSYSRSHVPLQDHIAVNAVVEYDPGQPNPFGGTVPGRQIGLGYLVVLIEHDKIDRETVVEHLNVTLCQSEIQGVSKAVELQRIAFRDGYTGRRLSANC